jgi:MFS family permease
MWFLKKFGRKTNLVFGIFVQGLMFWGMGMMYYYSWWGLLYPAAIIFILSFSLGMGGTSYAYIVEILPPIGVGLAMTCQWVFTAMIGYFIPTLAKENVLGVLPLFIIFGCLCIFGFFLLDWLVIETKDKSGSQIADEYKNLPYRFLR